MDGTDAFIAKWQGVAASELSTSQSFLIDLCELLGVEQAGTNSVVWLRDPMDEQWAWLHKSTTTPASTGLEQGEDWAEVAATQVAFAGSSESRV